MKIIFKLLFLLILINATLYCIWAVVLILYLLILFCKMIDDLRLT